MLFIRPAWARPSESHPCPEPALHERRFEMARAASEQLDDRHAEFCDAVGVARRRNVALQHAQAEMGFEMRNGALQQRGFAGARPADQVDGGDAVRGQLLANVCRDRIVGFQDIPQDFDIHKANDLFSSADAMPIRPTGNRLQGRGLELTTDGSFDAITTTRCQCGKMTRTGCQGWGRESAEPARKDCEIPASRWRL